MKVYKSVNRNLFFIKTLVVLFIALELIVFMTLSVVEHNVQNTRRTDLEESEKRIVALDTNISSMRFSSTIPDMLFLGKALGENMLAGTKEDVLGKNITYFSEEKKAYNNIILCDKGGNLVFNIAYDRLNGNSYYLEPPLDINFDEREKNLTKDQIFLSRLYLRTHGNKLILPVEPELRFSAPIYDDEGNFIGRIIMLYNISSYVSLLEDISKLSAGKTYLLNAAGDWIVNPDKTLQWGSVQDKEKDISFAGMYPEEWKRINDSLEGQFYTQNGLFTYSVIPIDTGSKALISSNRGCIVSHIAPDIKEYGEMIKREHFLEILRLTIKDNLSLFVVIFIIAIGGAVIITNNKISKDKIKFYSQYDAMTGLLNRRAGMEKLEELFEKKRRSSDAFTLCFMDVNGLKSVNDTLGHEDGDALIKTVADVISQNIREKDFAARMGGDEFMLVLEGSNEHGAQEIWGRITSRLDEINAREKRKYVVSVSCGMEELSETIKSVEDMINAADIKMYEQKRKVKETLQVIR